MIENNGKGADRLGKAKDGLKAPWRWSTNYSGAYGNEIRRIGQRCEAKLGDTIEQGDIVLEVTRWGSHYEAALVINGENITGYHVFPDDEIDAMYGEPLLTRLDAQKKAEKLGREFTKGINEVLRKHGL